MLTLQKPRRSLESLRALAASGSSGLARAAQQEIRSRTLEALGSCSEHAKTAGSSPK